MRKLKKSELKRVYGASNQTHESGGSHQSHHSGAHNHGKGGGIGGGSAATLAAGHSDGTHGGT